jgi:uncharacterized protein (DUF2235 family)
MLWNVAVSLRHKLRSLKPTSLNPNRLKCARNTTLRIAIETGKEVVMKRLVFCFDGTWNKLDAQYPTNVVLTAESVLPLTKDNVAQVVFYDEGVGTPNLRA